jgi:hypothetical protein
MAVVQVGTTAGLHVVTTVCPDTVCWRSLSEWASLVRNANAQLQCINALDTLVRPGTDVSMECIASFCRVDK